MKTRTRSRRAALALASVIAAPLVTVTTPVGAAPAVADTEGVVSWQLHSESGEYIGQGQDWQYGDADGRWYGVGSASGVGLGLDLPDGDHWSATFVPDEGHQLVAGTTFTGARTFPFNDPSTPGMRVHGMGRACGDLVGWFSVDQATYDPDSGEMTSFAVRFEEHCDGAVPGLSGEIRWHAADVDPPPAGGAAVPPAAHVVAQPAAHDLRLTWDDPSSVEWLDTLVHSYSGTTPPLLPEAYSLLYLGRTGALQLHVDDSRVDARLAITTRDSSGRRAAPVAVRVHGTRLSVTASADRVRAGDAVRVHGRLVDAQGEGIPGRPVRLSSERTAHAGSWHLVTTLTTDADGRWSLVRHPRISRDYRARAAGTPDSFPARTRRIARVIVRG